jgi:hypothetical protein
LTTGARGALHSRVLPILDRRTFVSLGLYASLTLSTSLQLTFGPEATLRLADYYTRDAASRDENFRSWYPDFGSLANDGPAAQALQHGELWKFSSLWGDAAYYVRQATHPEQSVPPYKYRFLPTTIVGALHQSTQLSVEAVFVIFNVLVSVLSALLFEIHLAQHFGFARVTSVLGGCLFITSTAITGTLAFPMLEPASALCSCLLFMAAYSRNALGFACAALAAVATKEILAFAGLLWWLHRENHESKWASALMAAIPVIAFGAYRLLLGGSAIEVNYGYNVLDGQFPAYGQRLFGLRSGAGLLVQIFLAFAFIWTGLLNALQHPLLRRSLPVVPLVLFASVLLSSRITRVIGVLYPIVIPAFLLYFDVGTAKAKTERA